ncbi:MAG: L-piperidine-6-carboxylate dehydrogenase [Gammaproteobacteria bacterium]
MKLLQDLGLETLNPGACAGPRGWLKSAPGPVLTSLSPSTTEPIGRVSVASASDYERVIQSAGEAFLAWRMIPAPRRGEVVRKIAQALREKKEQLGSLVSLEAGKIKQEGDGEVQEMIDIADFAVGQSRMLYGSTMHSERPMHRMYEQWHPLGIIGVITAFNFPVAVWAWNAFIAAVAGNTVVWRPSPKTPLCAIAVQKICKEVMEQEGCAGIFSLLIEEGAQLAERLTEDRRVALVSFTGSSRVGRRVGETVARRLGRSLLELSGNNAIIVDETADLDLAVPAIVFGAVGTAGQRCTSTRRLIVQQNKYDEVLERLLAAYQQVTIGDPLDPHVLMGPLIEALAVEKFQAAVGELQGLGGEIIYGGRVIERGGFFVQPTIARAENRWDIVQRETFAPILYVMNYRTLDEAIALNNDVPQGLSSALFSTDLRHAEQFLSALGSDCGIANINIGTSGAEIGGAFGGEKETGGGREAGSDAWKSYMQRQTNTINWGSELPLAQGIRFGISRGRDPIP